MAEAKEISLAGDGPWDLPLNGFEVLLVTFAYPIDLVAYADGGASATIRFEGAFELVQQDGTRISLDAASNSWEELSPVLSLRHDRLRSLRADESARLVVAFESGRVIEAGPGPRYETGRSPGLASSSSRCQAKEESPSSRTSCDWPGVCQERLNELQQAASEGARLSGVSCWARAGAPWSFEKWRGDAQLSSGAVV